MKTKLKVLLVLMAIFCTSLLCALITACVDGETVDYGNPETDGYRITVLYPDGSIVKGSDADFYLDTVTVELVDDDGNRVDPSAYAEVNEAGVAQINYFVPGVYHIQINDYPTGYAYYTVITSADKAFYTVKLKLAPPTFYTVNVTSPDGEPMENVTVKFMYNGLVAYTAKTGADGNATSGILTRDEYEIVLEGLPTGYSYKPASTTIAAFPVYVDIVGITQITFEDEDKLDEVSIIPWDSTLNSYTGLSLIRFDKDGDNYEYTAQVGAGEEVFFTIHAPKTGAYRIGSMAGNDYVIQFYNNDLTYFDSSLTITSETNNGNNIQIMQIEEGETLNFSVRTASRGAGTVKILVCMPVPAPLTTTATTAGNYTVTFQDYNTAILRFVTSPTTGAGFGAGVYRLTSKSDKYDVMIVEYANSYPAEDLNSDLTGEHKGHAGNDNGAADGRNFLFERSLTQSYLGVTLEYRIIIKDEIIDYPVQFTVSIERIGDAESEKVVTQNVATTDVSTQYGNQDGNFTWMPANGSLETYERNGKWYVMVDGEEKALVVAITKLLSGQLYSFATVEYWGENETMSSSQQNNKLTVYEDLTTMDTTWNYTNFIKQYSQFVNDDGVYEVNSELKLFLERFMNQRYDDITGSMNKPAEPWLLGCGYYANA